MSASTLQLAFMSILCIPLSFLAVPIGLVSYALKYAAVALCSRTAHKVDNVMSALESFVIQNGVKFYGMEFYGGQWAGRVKDNGLKEDVLETMTRECMAAVSHYMVFDHQYDLTASENVASHGRVDGVDGYRIAFGKMRAAKTIPREKLRYSGDKFQLHTSVELDAIRFSKYMFLEAINHYCAQ